MAIRNAIVVRADFDLGRLIGAVRPPPDQEFRVRVRRPDDLLVFDLLFENLELKTDGEPRLERRQPGAGAHLIVEFPPQSFGEEAFLQKSNADADDDKRLTDGSGYPPKNVPSETELLPPLPSARVRMAGPSRLAFTMPPGDTILDFTLIAVLDAMRTWPLRLDVSALPDLDQKILWPRPLGDWLAAAVASTAWSSTFDVLTMALEGAGARGSRAAIAASGQRIAERAAGGLSGSARRALGKVTLEAMQGELDELHGAFPVLRHGPAHQAGIAALSLATAGALASAASRTDVSFDVISELPFLPLLLAPHEPPEDVTALELPYRLQLSPIEGARWLHRHDLFVQRGRTELWHTRLTTAKGDTGPDAPAKVRAIWSPDYPRTDVLDLLTPKPTPFRMSLDPLDRQMLVDLMAGYDKTRGDAPRAYRPQPSRAQRLQLSSLGGLLDVEGNWDPRPIGVDLEQWRHLASVGRDQYVRVVYVGRLCAFGHAAALVKVTERKFEGAKNKRTAVLRQRFFIVCRERVRHYSGAGHVYHGHNFPFTRVEILTRVTPDLMEPGAGPSALQAVGGDVIYETVHYGGEDLPIVPRMAFWPMVAATSGEDGVDFRFEVVATDIAGQQVSFSVPLLFVGEVANAVKSGPIKKAYNASPTAKRWADLGSASVCYTPSDPGDKGDPRLPTASMTFAAGDLTSDDPHPTDPNFYPEMQEAAVGIRPLQKLLARPDAVVNVAYPSEYKVHGFDPSKNAGKLFLRLVDQAYPLKFGGGPNEAKSDTLGALAAPQMSILGVSKLMGPVAAAEPADLTQPAQVEAALAKIVSNTFDPTDFFQGATILGGIDLGEILALVTTGLAGSEVPKMLSRELADRVEATFDWTTTIEKSDGKKLLVPRAEPAHVTKLEMKSLVTTPLKDPGAATYEATASMTNFKINLFGFIILWFDGLSFAATKGQKPDVTVQLHGTDAVRFGGALEFVNQLRELIPSNGFSDPPALTVTPGGIAANYSLNLPTIGVGVFTLSNASLGAGFNLPFDARPASVSFRFSEREHPFSLTVSLLGGGGFFAIGVSSRGVQEIEAALEFGAGVAIDLGVASGSVEIKAGVYYHWLEPTPDKGSVELAGYVRLHGELSVLGLISASLTFNLQLSYKKEPGKSTVWGEATLVVEVEVLFFSADVSVRCRREFAGSKDTDPKFIDLIPDEATWTQYCEAFAEEAI